MNTTKETRKELKKALEELLKLTPVSKVDKYVQGAIIPVILNLIEDCDYLERETGTIVDLISSMGEQIEDLEQELKNTKDIIQLRNELEAFKREHYTVNYKYKWS